MKQKIESISTMIFVSVGYLLFCSTLPSFLAVLADQIMPWAVNAYYAIFSLLAGGIYIYLIYQKWGEEIGWKENITAKGIWEALIVGLFLFFFINFVVSPLLGQLFVESNANYYESVNTMYETPVATFFQVVCIAPLLEELVFRGFLLKRELRESKRWKAVCLVAFFFGLLHMSMVQGISAFLAGIILCSFYARRNSVGLTIVSHSFYNGLAYILMYCTLK